MTCICGEETEKSIKVLIAMQVLHDVHALFRSQVLYYLHTYTSYICLTKYNYAIFLFENNFLGHSKSAGHDNCVATAVLYLFPIFDITYRNIEKMQESVNRQY